MTEWIKGLAYTRRPEVGEVIRCTVEAGAMIAVKVYAGREVIAWDQIQEPDGFGKAAKIDSATAKRERLARDAAEHWRAYGFEVVSD